MEVAEGQDAKGKDPGLEEPGWKDPGWNEHDWEKDALLLGSNLAAAGGGTPSGVGSSRIKPLVAACLPAGRGV